jgi:hypothetical protein
MRPSSRASIHRGRVRRGRLLDRNAKVIEVEDARRLEQVDAPGG